jgi:hypothetical protein
MHGELRKEKMLLLLWPCGLTHGERVGGCLVSCTRVGQADRVQGLSVWLPGAPSQPGCACAGSRKTRRVAVPAEPGSRGA